jgi:enterochelin esterase-like enzyme
VTLRAVPRLVAALALSWAAAAGAQGTASDPGADGSRPASSNVRGAQYPRVHPDGRVTFRLRAPDARAVKLNPGGPGLAAAPLDMTRGADSAWTVTTPPAVPGFHYYWFLVDGTMVMDPSSETFFGYGRPTSGVEVPEPGVDWYEPRDVPHGEVRARWYRSKVTGAWRRAYVYTPPGYDASPARRYPVLYLQHGAGEDERGWHTQGRLQFILDNLIAERRAVPMLVVMDQGYATRAGPPPQPALPPGTPLGAMAPGSAFEAVLLDELIPTIDAAYRTEPRREQRALAGLSMGGGQALQIGLTHLDRFAWIGAFSGAGVGRVPVEQAYGGVFADAKGFNAKVRLLYFGAGTEEAQFHQGAKALTESLGRLGVRSVFVESPGTAHEWQTWRRALHDFAPRLFRPAGAR